MTDDEGERFLLGDDLAQRQVSGVVEAPAALRAVEHLPPLNALTGRPVQAPLVVGLGRGCPDGHAAVLGQAVPGPVPVANGVDPLGLQDPAHLPGRLERSTALNGLLQRLVPGDLPDQLLGCIFDVLGRLQKLVEQPGRQTLDSLLVDLAPRKLPDSAGGLRHSCDSAQGVHPGELALDPRPGCAIELVHRRLDALPHLPEPAGSPPLRRVVQRRRLLSQDALPGPGVGPGQRLLD